MSHSSSLFQRARQSIPGGVNSPVRAFLSVGGTPPFIARGAGSRIVDADGREYIDCVMSWGPLILGHAAAEVVDAVCGAARSGTSFGAPTERETELAELIISHLPGIEKVRLVSSGTEATMSAVRLARAYTGREKIVKFEGCYHGHADTFLLKAGSGALTHGMPSSPGVPSGIIADTLIGSYNDADSVARLFAENPGRIAAIIVEPVAGNMGVVLPAPGFLQTLRDSATREGARLIFDEVITGFRLGLGGAQGFFGVTPDITTLGKTIGGGLPVGAYGGRADIMSKVSPEGPMYQAGTLSGNPCAVAGGLATLRALMRDQPYASLSQRGAALFDGLREIARASGVTAAVNAISSMGTLFFGIARADSYEHIMRCDTALFARFHTQMLRRGVYLPPSQFEALFISTAHTEKDIETVLEAARQSIACIA